MLLPGALDRDLDEALAHYREHGFARIGAAIAEPTLAALRARADDIMLGRVEVPGLFFQHDSGTGSYDDLTFGEGWIGPSPHYRKIEKLERDALFRALLENALFEKIARAVIPGELSIYRAVLFSKAASGGSNLPFHQDGGSFWGLDRNPELTIWTALDDAEEHGGCVEFVPGSHRGGLVTPLGGIVPAPDLERHGAEARAVKVPAKAGEILLIHNLVWHRSARSSSGHPRRAFTVCYMSAETRCLRKKRAPREFVRVFDRRLA